MVDNFSVPEGRGETQSFRKQILILHGGGFRGLFSAALLENFEKDLGRPIIDSFDLIAGTSIGGLIALALASGKSCSDIREKFEKKGAELFPSTSKISWLPASLFDLLVPKYDPKKLEELIREIMITDRPLIDIEKKILVPCIDLANKKARIFKSFGNHKSKESILDVAMATSAAPTYFQPHQFDDDPRQFVDGGLVANSPSWIALTKAITELRWDIDSIRMLVIGTTKFADGELLIDRSLAGGAYWVRKKRILNLILESQQNLADFMCEEAVGSNNFCEINQFRSEQQNKFAGQLDQATPESISALKSMANTAYEESKSDTAILKILKYKAR